MIAAALDMPVAINGNDKTILDFSFFIPASAVCLEVLRPLKKDCAKFYLYAKKSNISNKNILKGHIYALLEKEDNLSL